MRDLRRADLFCEVIDNFGDAGVCWRLARALAAQGLRVTLWIDDLQRLQRLRPGLDPARDEQAHDGFSVRRWLGEPRPDSDLVISAFGCRLAEATLAAMAARDPKPVWINLEYLSAERWVEGSHRLPSPHPRLPLVQHFFFPGFTPRTGGLLKEAGFDAARATFDAGQRAAFLGRLGIPVSEDALLVSLFCYPSAQVDSLFAAMRAGPPVLCVVPEGVTPLAPAAGETRRDGALTLHGLRFLEPDDYDRLLWSCDFNFVRGEDSAVRAQWARRPFAWQLYPQPQDAHFDKLDAFFELYSKGLNAGVSDALRVFLRAWNGDPTAVLDWGALRHALPALAAHADEWPLQMAAAGDLASALVEFAREIG